MKNTLKGLDKFYFALEKIELPFKGLAHTSLLLIKKLITCADPMTGIVSGITYGDLAISLAINAGPGRRVSGTPTKQTIRNYIKSIERECNIYFKVVSEGQKLQFLFPYLPKIFNEFFASSEVNMDLNSHKTLKGSDVKEDFRVLPNIELNTPSSTVKNIIFNNINNNNNNKQSISNNFTPNSETISRAKALGYSNVEDSAEIQNFISYNKACGAQWADFNPIYLRWLAKSQERQQQTPQMKNTWSFNHENQQRNKTKTNTSSVRERVIQAYANEFTFCEETRRFDSKAEQEQRIYCDFVAPIN
ncbi:hypothetical protein ACD661_16185 [Legionella lytica]|uniref:Legionella vir region protein LvrA n=1 Tax=Legionella lytica TaxID=96232 RepID=A0ABW8DBL9_9GAMM